MSELERHMEALISLDESDTPVVSVFLDRERPDGRRILAERIARARRAAAPADREDIDRAFATIERWLDEHARPGARGLAAFARAGDRPFFHELEFAAPLPTRAFVETVPVIFHLVEMKDNFHRYVLVIAGESGTRILEVSLGAVTRRMWTERPELRRRVGREWTREHYRNRLREAGDRMVREAASVIEDVLRSGGHTHLVLSGNAQVCARIRQGLPRWAAERIADTVPSSTRDRTEDVVRATLAAFVEQERMESLAVVDRLRQELLRDGLAVAGPGPSRDALAAGQADILVLSAEYEPEETLAREELVRLARASDVHVEVADGSDVLREMGGAGCLLRYRTPDPARSALAAAIA